MKTQEEAVAEQATGCPGAGDYRRWAKSQGYQHCEVVDWTSSAGDWSFIVSKDGHVWYAMFQNNNFPRAGFTRTVDTARPFFGNSDEVMTEICTLYG